LVQHAAAIGKSKMKTHSFGSPAYFPKLSSHTQKEKLEKKQKLETCTQTLLSHSETEIGKETEIGNMHPNSPTSLTLTNRKLKLVFIINESRTLRNLSHSENEIISLIDNRLVTFF